MAIIEFDNVSFAYGDGRRALDGLSLRIEPGELVAVLGCNGSGKSTLARHMNALLVPDEGTVTVLGHDTRDPSATVSVRSSVGMVFQNPDDQIVATLVKDDVAFGPSNLGVSDEELDCRVLEALERVGLESFDNHEVATLSGGQKQLVAVAGALAMRPHALVLDEADAMLDPAGRKRLLGLCRELADTGMAVVLVTHHLESAAQADRAIALAEGSIAIDGPAAKALEHTERLEELGLYAPFRRSHAPARSKQQADEAPALAFESVTFSYPDAFNPALNDLSFSVERGEILGVEGPMGCGKSTLAQLAGGLQRPSAGRVLLDGRDLAGNCESRHEIGVVFQHPEHQLFAATVFDDVAFGPRNLELDEQQVERRVREALESVGLGPEPELLNRSPFALSGGQQRRVAIAGVLACQPRVLVLDEACAGLDAIGRRQLLELLDRLNAERGLTVIFISHDREDLDRLCDRVLRLR